MKTIFVIGGMGAGKSTAAKMLASYGTALVDLDKVGHEILHWDVVKRDILDAFGERVFTEEGEVSRRALARASFTSEGGVSRLNAITLPRIRERYKEYLDEYESAGASLVVVESSAFKGKETADAFRPDMVILVSAPLETRINRAIAAGWHEEDVRARIARQVSDEERMNWADAVFDNSGTPEDLAATIDAWWRGFQEEQQG